MPAAQGLADTLAGLEKDRAAIPALMVTLGRADGLAGLDGQD